MSKRKEQLNEHYEIEILPIKKLKEIKRKLKELLLESLRRGQVKCVSSRILFPISGINSVSLTFFCFLGG